MTNETARHGEFTRSTIARGDGPERSVVGPVELFFDLVYVFAIVQLSHLLAHHLSWVGFAKTTIVFAAIWWGWNYTAWAMNWLNPANGIVQLLNAVLMLLALGMAIAIPDAFGSLGLLFAGCFVLMGLIRPIFMVTVFRGQVLAQNYRVLGAWSATAGVLWIVGAFLEPGLRIFVWAAAVVVDYTAPRLQFRFPGLGSAPMTQWDPNPEHLAERNRLVFIIALGESILVMGGSIVAAGGSTTTTIVSLIVGFASLTALWFNYFALAGDDVQGGEGGTAALRSAYAYAHALMVGGAILVAVSMELRLSHEHSTTAMILVTIGGPLLYLIGNVLFLRSRFGRIAQSRFAAAGILVAIGIVATIWQQAIPTLVLSLAVLIVTGGLAVSTARSRTSRRAHST